MAPIRLRHPKGVTTLQIDINNSTVLDLQQVIFSSTEIPPSRQDLKAGYPPQPLTIIPELPLESLGLKAGEQLIVTEKRGPVQSNADPVPAVPSPSAPMSGVPAPQARDTPRVLPDSASSAGPESVPVEGGYLVHRVVPDDNSCLFSSIALIFEQDIRMAQQIREIVAEAIRNDAETWNEAILGRSREEYISTILKPSAWGGAIELTILSSYYSTEIASIDIETGRIDRFTPPSGRSSGNRAVLIYSGIHYDAASVAPILNAPDEFYQTIVPIVGDGDSDDDVLKAAKKLADKLRAKRAYTNTATFDLRCQICDQGLKGEKQARQHAMETGHAEFGEY